MRAGGIISFVLAVLVLFYAWFAAGWDGGTARVTADRIMIALSLLLIGGSFALILGKRRAMWLVAPLWLAVLAAALLP